VQAEINPDRFDPIYMQPRNLCTSDNLLVMDETARIEQSSTWSSLWTYSRGDWPATSLFEHVPSFSSFPELFKKVEPASREYA
jgi:hypothetical protein